jgi:hypothetical protein
MPWTFAHPAAILPLRPLCPRWLSFPGLILGAMAPDLSYYVGMHGQWSAFCHTPEGIALVCLPASLLLLALLLRFSRPLTVLLPEPHRALVRGQLQQPVRARWMNLLVAVVSVLIGAASHVLWDSFTHQGRWGAELLPELDAPLVAAMDQQVHVTQLLQHLSTAVGVVALAIVYGRAWRAQRPATPRRPDARPALLLAGLVAAVIVGAASAFALTPAKLPAYHSHLLVRTVVWSTSCFAALFVVGSVAWWRRRGDA